MEKGSELALGVGDGVREAARRLIKAQSPVGSVTPPANTYDTLRVFDQSWAPVVELRATSVLAPFLARKK